MLELLDFDRLEEILILIIPGFVSLKVWTLINPTARLKMADYLLDIIAFSTLNFVALSWLLLLVEKSSSVPQLVRVVVTIAVFVVFPAAWPVLLRAILSSELLSGRIINPVPLAWDHFFGKGKHCFVLVHLKNGNVLGGLYTGESFASSYPEPQEIFLSEVWRVDESGRFQHKIEETKGVLVNHEVIEYLEFYNTEGASSEEPRGRPNTKRG